MPEGRLLIIEDHEVLGTTLALALRAEGYDVEALMAEEDAVLIEHASKLEPDVVLLDLDLGEGRTSVPLIGPLRGAGAEVVIVTGSTDKRLIAEALAAGASGTFSKSAPFAELVEAVEKARSHRDVTPVADREEMLRDLRESKEAERRRLAPFEGLTPRECVVLRGLMEGKAAEAIARDEVVSLPTVRTQIRSILLKLGAHSQLEAVAKAREAGWAG